MTLHKVSHDRADETIEAKALWFQSLSLEERMDMLCWFTDMILAVNPGIVEQKDAEPIAGRVLVLAKSQRTTNARTEKITVTVSPICGMQIRP